ncbi:MAG TPA: rhomboid family intramembrane serine protease [Bryobacteraceae bacterium]|nr:rhomboid family intramembrane serine protease [Bryobacteraceae bacterium]HUO33134.1 rhomboid family intramembrane serine protease [Bryobacteraceae bacterium]
MIPLRSSEPHYTRATVTLAIIAANVAVFLYELSIQGTLGTYALNRFIELHGIVPAHLRYSSVFTSMFIHGGFLHIAGNMWFLWVFGRSVEDLLGHTRYLIFYLVCGVAAAFAHILLNPFSPVPTIGASGAIAGVMGGYLIKFPRAHVVTLVFIFIFITTVDIPAFVLLLYWFAMQFFNGVGSIGYSQASSGDVAWFAHVGGFLAGMALIWLMPTRQRFRSSWSRDV